jgi:hypothetical protein
MGIEYGGYMFTDPVPLLNASLPETSGLFAIQLFDSSRPGRRFRAIYFGETQSFAGPAFPLQHEDYAQWIREAHPGLLFVSVFRTPLWNEWCRKNATSKLRALHRAPRSAPLMPPARPPEMGHLAGA